MLVWTLKRKSRRKVRWWNKTSSLVKNATWMGTIWWQLQNFPKINQTWIYFWFKMYFLRFEFHIPVAWTNDLVRIPSRYFLRLPNIWLDKQKTDADIESMIERIQKPTMKFHLQWNLPKSFLDSTQSTEFSRRKSQKCMLRHRSSWQSSQAQQTKSILETNFN